MKSGFEGTLNSTGCPGGPGVYPPAPQSTTPEIIGV